MSSDTDPAPTGPRIYNLFPTLLAPIPRWHERLPAIADMGFDYRFNSAKWWDFRQDWLLEEYEQFCGLAPSIAFPESHDTPRLAAETGGDARESRLRYLFAALFSTGVMMPIGYELGFRKPLHVVETGPDDWQTALAESAFDISAYIGRVNAMKAATPVLNEEGPQERFTGPDAPLVGLLRRSERTGQRSLALINPDPEQTWSHPAKSLPDLLAAAPSDLREITPPVESEERWGERRGETREEPRGEPGPTIDTIVRDADGRVPVPPRSIRLFLGG